MTHPMISSRPSMLLLSLVLVSFFHYCSAFDCELGGSQSFVDKLRVLDPKSCPTILDSSDKKFCCTERNTGLNVCCDLADFLSTDIAIMVGVGIIVGILISCFLCCCCCPCCFLYKRRSQPGTVVAVQAYQQVPAYPVQPTYVVQHTMPVGYQQAQGHQYQQPPAYCENTTASAAYSKQSPYNPSY